MAKMMLYHVTPSANYDSIYEAGLNPAFAIKGARRVWAVKYSYIPWAIAHVVSNKRVAVSELMVIPLKVDRDLWKLYNRQIFYSEVAHLLPDHYTVWDATTILERWNVPA